MNSVYGRYKSLRDASEYEYDATWREISGCLTWSASVRTGGRAPVGYDGLTYIAEAAAGESAVREAIATAIERRVSD